MAEFTVTIKNQTLSFRTNQNVFSPGALDSGTAAMLSVAEFLPGDKVLDLGCGYGPVGILAAKLISPGQVAMCDISEDALSLAVENAAKNGIAAVLDGGRAAQVTVPAAGDGRHAAQAAVPAAGDREHTARGELGVTEDKIPPAGGFLRIFLSDGLSAIPDHDYTKILSNPPYHTDFSVAKGFIEDGYSHLVEGGMMYMVTKRREWYKNKLAAVFGGVHIDEVDGYYVFTAQKRAGKSRRAKTDKKNPAKLSKKLARKEMRKHRI